jgi:hypothetical protein
LQSCWPHNNTLKSITSFCEQLEYSPKVQKETSKLLSMINIQDTKLVNGDKRLTILQWVIPLLKGIQFIVLWGSAPITAKNFIEDNFMEEGKKLNSRVAKFHSVF